MTEADISGVTLTTIFARSDALRANLLRTPSIMLGSQRISERLNGSELFLKLECFQHTGTFKARGALSVALQIPDAKRANGVTAASAGNHAASVCATHTPISGC